MKLNLWRVTMAMKHTIERVEQAVKLELEEANKNFPQFHSRHEALGVIREEYKELCDMVERVGREYKQFEHCVFNDLVMDADIGEIAVLAAGEAIQVAAMWEKYKALDKKSDT